MAAKAHGIAASMNSMAGKVQQYDVYSIIMRSNIMMMGATWCSTVGCNMV